MNLLEQMEHHAREIFKAADEKLPASMQAEVMISPGGLTTVRYLAACGNVMGKGVTERRIEFGSGPEVAAEALIDTMRRSDIGKKIRLHYLKLMAEELGMEVTPSKKRKEDA